MAAVFAIIYAEKTKAIRRIIVPDNEKELPGFFVAPGETMLVCRDSEYDLDTCNILVELATGVAPASSECAVVDPLTNRVLEFLHADPELDTLPGKTLVTKFDKRIAPGSLYDPAQKSFKVDVKQKDGTTVQVVVTEPVKDDPVKEDAPADAGAVEAVP